MNDLSIASVIYLNSKQLIIDDPKISLVELTMLIMKQCEEADIPYNNIPVHIAFQTETIKLEPTKVPDEQAKPASPVATAGGGLIGTASSQVSTLIVQDGLVGGSSVTSKKY